MKSPIVQNDIQSTISLAKNLVFFSNLMNLFKVQYHYSRLYQEELDHSYECAHGGQHRGAKVPVH